MLPLIIKIFSVLGLSIVSMGAAVILFNTLISQVQDMWDGLPVAVIQYLSLAGVPAVLGMVVGAQATVLSFHALKKLRFI